MGKNKQKQKIKIRSGASQDKTRKRTVELKGDGVGRKSVRRFKLREGL